MRMILVGPDEHMLFLGKRRACTIAHTQLDKASAIPFVPHLPVHTIHTRTWENLGTTWESPGNDLGICNDLIIGTLYTEKVIALYHRALDCDANDGRACLAQVLDAAERLGVPVPPYACEAPVERQRATHATLYDAAQVFPEDEALRIWIPVFAAWSSQEKMDKQNV